MVPTILDLLGVRYYERDYDGKSIIRNAEYNRERVFNGPNGKYKYSNEEDLWLLWEK